MRSVNALTKTAAKQAPAAGPAAMLEAARHRELAALRKEHQELHAAVVEAAQIQRRLCSPREMRRGPFEMAGEMFPVRHLSGDFLKLLDLGEEIGLVVGDIAGKGISAGMWVPHLVELARAQTTQKADPAAVMAFMNRELCAALAEPPMTAMLLARLNPASGQLTYCNAGQPPLLLLRGGCVESLNAGGPMLGALPDARFDSGRVQMEPGDTLIACTDGVVECRNRRDEEYGSRQLANAAAAAEEDTTAGQKLFSLLGSVLDFGSGRPLDDDLTLLVVQRRGKKPGGAAT